MFQDLNPLDRSTAVMEIIIMLLVAFILGFLLAWILKRSRRGTDTTSETDDQLQNTQLTAQNKELKSKLAAAEASLQQAQTPAEQVDTDALKQQVAQLQVGLQACEEGSAQQQKALADENASLRDKILALEKQLVSTESALSEIKASDAENAAKLGFVAVASDRKDDLTQISGIGPFIEKKLNGLGIYTFEQIGGFTPETVQKVTEAIEFFPGRIERDNWIDQAKALK